MTETSWAFIHPFQLRLQRGIEIYLWNLASALAQQGINVDILTWAGLLEVPDFARIPGIHLRKVPSVRYFQAQFAVLYYVFWLLKGDYQYVFVHFAGYGEGPALRLARWIRSLPFSVVFHFPPSLVPHRYREFDDWGIHRSADHLIGVSQATVREVQQWAGRPCSVIKHGVNVERFHSDAVVRAQIRKNLNIEPDAPVLITVAALEERKGVQWVIEALPKVIARFPKTRYLVIGDGPYRDTLEKQVQSQQLQQQVMLLGFRADVIPYLSASDIALVLSKGEASSISLLESCACALPAITSRHDPFPELVQSEWGEMVNEQDTEILSQKIITLLSDSNLRKHKGANGRSWVTQNHSWPQVAREYLNLLESRR